MDYDDRGLPALPKLVGAPKYSRPPGAGAPRTDRPPDPDDLPLESERSPEDQALAAELGLAAPPLPVVNGEAAGAASAEGIAGPGDAHSNGAWTAAVSVSTGASAKSAKRGLGVLFRGRSGQPGAD